MQIKIKADTHLLLLLIRTETEVTRGRRGYCSLNDASPCSNLAYKENSNYRFMSYVKQES